MVLCPGKSIYYYYGFRCTSRELKRPQHVFHFQALALAYRDGTSFLLRLPEMPWPAMCGSLRCADHWKDSNLHELTYLLGQLYRARSRLYRSQNLQVNTRWKALDEIYKICMLLHRSDLNILANVHQFLGRFQH